ncbi:MAG: hypothetical protein K0S41_3721 [Anaerocolumna sp.]|nr:hypothetical protein [Anaerocolumna sp.]
MSRIKNVLIVILSVSTIGLVALFFHVYKENITYQAYLSDILANRVSSIITNNSDVEKTLKDIIKNKTITKKEVATLYEYYSNMKEQSTYLVDSGIQLGRIQKNRINRVINTSSKIAEYFKRIYYTLSSNEVDELTSTQIDGLKQFQSLALLYKKVIRTYVSGIIDDEISGEFWNLYYKQGVKDNYWSNMIVEFEDVTPDYTGFTLLK